MGESVMAECTVKTCPKCGTILETTIELHPLPSEVKACGFSEVVSGDRCMLERGHNGPHLGISRMLTDPGYEAYE